MVTMENGFQWWYLTNNFLTYVVILLRTIISIRNITVKYLLVREHKAYNLKKKNEYTQKNKISKSGSEVWSWFSHYSFNFLQSLKLYKKYKDTQKTLRVQRKTYIIHHHAIPTWTSIAVTLFGSIFLKNVFPLFDLTLIHFGVLQNSMIKSILCSLWKIRFWAMFL